MDNPRTLPPLVRGKVSGVLDFFIDEIIISRNVLFLTDKFDITAQLRWWGETSPAYIRPKILQLRGKISTGSQSIKAYSHSAKYEVKTTLDLFKSYLKACEILELTIYEAVSNFVIGSAFLKNLCNLLNRSEFILSPIIDYSGEEIGQIKIHTNFFKQPETDEKHNFENKISKNFETRVSEPSKSNFFFPAEKTIVYDGCSKLANFEVESYNLDKSAVKDKNHAPDVVLSNFGSNMSLNNHVKNQVAESSKGINFPNVCVSRDSSKILNFELGGKSQSKVDGKFTSNSIKCKSKTEKPSVGIPNAEKFPKKMVSKNVATKKTNTKLDVKGPVPKQSSESLGNKTSEGNVSETSNKRVFDYLLGSAMSKENEESALKDFKEMSPSHDIVSSINDLCLTLNKSNICANNCRKQNLCFDLTNPIEKNYYEKFFNSSNDFEIAGLLNDLENSSSLLKNKNIVKSKTDTSSIPQTETEKCDYQLDNLNMGSKNGCARCKYYKKLDELDTIIESLKHFEKNMLKEEKSLDFDSNLKKQRKVSDR